jgi:hypothetical protein
MAQYVIVYLGGNQPATPEEGKQHFTKYMEWLSSLGDSAVSPANPLKDTSTVNPDGTVTAVALRQCRVIRLLRQTQWTPLYRLQKPALFLILVARSKCRS